MEPMSMLATLVRFWRELLIGLLLGLLSLQTVRLNSANHELELIKTRTEVAKEQSNATIEKLRESIPAMVSTAQTNAIANYRAKFGTGNAACGIRISGVLPYSDGSETGRTTGTPEPHQPEPMACDTATIEAAAVDAVMLEAWKDWARSNGLKEK